MTSLSATLHHFSQLYYDRAIVLEDEQRSPDSASIRCRVRRNGRPGRPTVIVPKSIIELLLEQGFSYTSISRMLGISTRTLLRRRVQYELPTGRPYSEISDIYKYLARKIMILQCKLDKLYCKK